MKSVGFIYDDIFLRHETPLQHPESKERLIAVLKKMGESGLINKVVNIKPRRAIFDEIALVHSSRYIDRISENGEGYLDSDTYLSVHSFEASLYAAGAVIEAVDRCRSNEISRAFCAVRPPGHHAEERTAMGFCIFNNIAIGARYAQKHGYKRIFIVDFDVHHGNGTQHAFNDDNSVFYFSTHQFPLFPGTGSSSEKGKGSGEGFTLNIPLAPGAGDAEYADAYRNILPPLVKGFKPDLILVSAGYDILESDPLSSIRVTQNGLKEILQGILGCASVPFIFVLEGGYDLDALAEAVASTIRELLK